MIVKSAHFNSRLNFSGEMSSDMKKIMILTMSDKNRSGQTRAQARNLIFFGYKKTRDGSICVEKQRR